MQWPAADLLGQVEEPVLEATLQLVEWRGGGQGDPVRDGKVGPAG